MGAGELTFGGEGIKICWGGGEKNLVGGGAYGGGGFSRWGGKMSEFLAGWGIPPIPLLGKSLMSAIYNALTPSVEITSHTESHI